MSIFSPEVLQYLVDGLTLGAVYGLIALGYTMVYGVIGMINFAHGDIYMLGAYAAAITLGLLSWLPWPLALLAAAAVAGGTAAAYALLAERLAYRPLRGAPRIMPLISAVGVSVFLQNWVPLLRGPRAQSAPSMLADPLITYQFANFTLSIGANKVLIWVVTAASLALFAWLLTRTNFGRMQRALAQDMVAARLMGVPVNYVIAMTFALGALLAGVAGTLNASYYGIVTFTDGFAPGMKAFAAAVLGGIGSLPGAVLGGLLIGLTEALWAGLISGNSKDAAAFLLLIVVLILRPSGFFGRPETEKV